jgi:acyl-coenzyme A thioesterase PaaI-like protein
MLRAMTLRERLLVRLVSLKIPSLLFMGPRLRRLDDEVCEVEIPLGWRTRNHVGVMYVGVLCAGADLASGLHAARLVLGKHRDVVLLFADLRAEFLKRADGDVLFRSSQGREVADAVRRAAETGERVTLPVEVVATVPRRHGDEPVARFTLSLTLKRRAEAKVEAPSVARAG